MNNFSQYVLPPVLGFIAGAIASIIVPWVNWGIEKRRMKLNNRKKLIKDVRACLFKFNSNHEGFIVMPEYGRIKHYLSKSTRHRLETIPIKITGSGSITITSKLRIYDDDYPDFVLDELHELEKRWEIM
jgi:hypothetical protein